MSRMNISEKPVVQSDMISTDFDIICRLCLAISYSSLRTITEKDICLLNHIADLEITQSDGLPTNICENCAQTIDVIINFINQSKQSQHALTKILSSEKKLKGHLTNDSADTGDHQHLNHEESSQDKHNNQRDDIENPFDKLKSELTNEGTKCPHCNLSFENEISLKDHYRNNSICLPEEQEVNEQDKSEHQNNHSEKTLYNCTYCPKEFKFKSKLEQHTHRHQVKLGLVERCEKYREKRIHLKLKCEICEKIFSSRSGFQYHKMKHDGKELPKRFVVKKNCKTFLCYYCAKNFHNKSNLDAHLRTHTGEKPFKCSYCSKDFRQQSALKRHITNHIGNKRQLFSCKTCQKKFTTKAHRDIHERIHTGEKPYKCRFCFKTFNYRTQWQIHVRMHTGESPFMCNTCQNTYHDKGSLRKHQKKKGHFQEVEANPILDCKKELDLHQ